MFVRTASERDLAGISALLAETWHATYDEIYGTDGVNAISERWHSIAWLRQMLLRVRSEFIVADSGEHLAGVAYAVINETDPGVVELHELDVRPGMQGRGVGGMLLQEVEGSFFECRLMRLEVEEKNDRAMGFYKANGFVERDRRPATQWVDAMIVVLEKPMH